MAKEDWKTVGPNELATAIGTERAADVWTKYELSKQAYREYKSQRDVFEIAMQIAFEAKMPAGMELKFGYNFGKLSIAVGPVSERKAQPKAAGESLGDWLAGQAQSGCRT